MNPVAHVIVSYTDEEFTALYAACCPEDHTDDPRLDWAAYDSARARVIAIGRERRRVQEERGA